MKKVPMLSIITVAAFDHERLSQTINSLINLPPEIEHVLVIPKNDETSLNIIRDLTFFSSTNIKVFYDANSGIYPAMNIGGKHALGRYICFWNAGDRLHSHANMQTVIQSLTKNNPSWAIVQGVFDWHTPQIMTASSVNDFILHKAKAFISHPTVMVNKKIFQGINGFNTRYKVASDSSQIAYLFENWTPLFLDIPVVEVESPVFAARHNRRGRFENLLIGLLELKGRTRMIALRNILSGEFNQFQNRFRKN